MFRLLDLVTRTPVPVLPTPALLPVTMNTKGEHYLELLRKSLKCRVSPVLFKVLIIKNIFLFGHFICGHSHIVIRL